MINTLYRTSRGLQNLKFPGLKRRLGITQWREFSEDMTQGLKNLQESATYKRTAENLQFAKVLFHEFWENTIFKHSKFKSLVDCTNLQDIAREKSAGLISGISASSSFQVLPFTIVVNQINMLTNTQMNFI